MRAVSSAGWHANFKRQLRIHTQERKLTLDIVRLVYQPVFRSADDAFPTDGSLCTVAPEFWKKNKTCVRLSPVIKQNIKGSLFKS